VAVLLIRFLSVFDSIDGDLVTLQRKEDAMGAYPEPVAIDFGLQFRHIALKIGTGRSFVGELHPSTP
jgi:hypothetical protein